MPPKLGMAMGTMMSEPRPVEVNTGSRARMVVVAAKRRRLFYPTGYGADRSVHGDGRDAGSHCRSRTQAACSNRPRPPSTSPPHTTTASSRYSLTKIYSSIFTLNRQNLRCFAEPIGRSILSVTSSKSASITLEPISVYPKSLHELAVRSSDI